MKRINFIQLCWILAGLLALSGTILTTSQRQETATPSINSLSPSGASAFADLLKRQGYRIDQTNSVNPRFASTDLVVAVSLYGDFELGNERERSIHDGVRSAINEYLHSGGRVLSLQLLRNLDSWSPRTERFAAPPGWDGPVNVTIGAESQQSPFRSYGSRYQIGGSGPSPAFAEIFKEGSGVAVSADGYMATNEYLSQADNAQTLMRLVRTLAPAGSRVLFVDSTWDEAHVPGLLERFGDWVLAGYFQALLVIAVVFFSFGRTFGIRRSERLTQQGGKEFVGAVGFLYQRTGYARFALEATIKRAEIAIVKKARPSRDSSIDSLRVYEPLDLALESGRQIAKVFKPDADRAFAAAQLIDRELSVYLAS